MTAPSNKPTPYTPKSLPVIPGGGLPYTKRELDRLSETMNSTQALLATEATATPAMDGTASIGSSLVAAREDHVHPTDTTRAAVTALPAPATVAPLIDGTAAVGTSLLYARQDHVHPSNAPSPATATPIADGVAAVGMSLLYARQDHVHPQSGWQTLAIYTPSAVASQAIPLPSGFERYRLTYQNTTISTNGGFLGFQVSINGGSTYITTTSYANFGFYLANATTITPFLSGTTNGLLSIGLLASTPAEGVFEIVPGTASLDAMCNGRASGNINAGSWYTGQFSNAIVAGAAINQLKVTVSTGTFSGTIILEGLP